MTANQQARVERCTQGSGKGLACSSQANGVHASPAFLACRPARFLRPYDQPDH
jgi:hypothetical protein